MLTSNCTATPSNDKQPVQNACLVQNNENDRVITRPDALDSSNLVSTCRTAFLLIQSSHPFRRSRQAAHRTSSADHRSSATPSRSERFPSLLQIHFCFPSSISPVVVDIGAVARTRKMLDQRRSNGQPSCRVPARIHIRLPCCTSSRKFVPRWQKLTILLPRNGAAFNPQKPGGDTLVGRPALPNASPGIAVHQ